VSPDATLLSLAAEHHWLATTADVAVAGMSAGQWLRRRDSGEWAMVAPGVWRHQATPLTWEMRLRAGLMSLGGDAAVAGEAAAAWWLLAGFEPGPVEFVVPRRRRATRWPEAHLTRSWSRGDVLVHKGLRVTSATRTIIDLAAWGCSARRVEEAIDGAVRARRTSVPTLSRRMAELSGRGRTGTLLLRELLLDSGGESYLERRFLRLMRRAGLPRPDCQVVHARVDGPAMRVDFQFAVQQVVVEVSGRVGHASDAARQRDARRRNELDRQGWTVREFSTADVLDDPSYVVATLRPLLVGR
jgi:hypothetical protein